MKKLILILLLKSFIHANIYPYDFVKIKNVPFSHNGSSFSIISGCDKYKFFVNKDFIASDNYQSFVVPRPLTPHCDKYSYYSDDYRSCTRKVYQKSCKDSYELDSSVYYIHPESYSLYQMFISSSSCSDFDSLPITPRGFDLIKAKDVNSVKFFRSFDADNLLCNYEIDHIIDVSLDYRCASGTFPIVKSYNSSGTDSSFGGCITCPPGEIYNYSTKQCSQCPACTFFDNSTETCKNCTEKSNDMAEQVKCACKYGYYDTAYLLVKSAVDKCFKDINVTFSAGNNTYTRYTPITYHHKNDSTYARVFSIFCKETADCNFDFLSEKCSSDENNTTPPDDNNSSNNDDNNNNNDDNNNNNDDNNNNNNDNNNSNNDNNESNSDNDVHVDVNTTIPVPDSNDTNTKPILPGENNSSSENNLTSGKLPDLGTTSITDNINKMSDSFNEFVKDYTDKIDELVKTVDEFVKYIKDNGFLEFYNDRVENCPLKFEIDLKFSKVPVKFDLCEQLSFLYNAFYFLVFSVTMFFGLRYLLNKSFYFLGGD